MRHCPRAVDLTAAKFHPRVGRFEHELIEWFGEAGNPYETCKGIFHYLGSGADKPRPYANPYPGDVLVFSSGMHDDRPGHKSDFLGLEAFVANQLGNLFTSDAENSCVQLHFARARGTQTPCVLCASGLESLPYPSRRPAARVYYRWIAVSLKGGKQAIPTHYTLGEMRAGSRAVFIFYWPRLEMFLLLPSGYVCEIDGSGPAVGAAHVSGVGPRCAVSLCHAGYHEIGNDLFAPRHWELQGSVDGMKWSTLMVRVHGAWACGCSVLECAVSTVHHLQAAPKQ